MNMTAAWKTKDKQWMKERRDNWKLARELLDHASLTGAFHWLKKSEQVKILRQYYLTGTEETDYPIRNFSSGAFLRIWLDADHSQENWSRIRQDSSAEEWRAAERVFHELNAMTASGRFACFMDKEKALHELFYRKGFKREYFCELDACEWQKIVEFEFNAMCRELHCCLSWPTTNPVCAMILEFDRWLDSFDQGYRDSAEFSWMVFEMHRVLNNKVDYEPFIAELAEKIRLGIFESNRPPSAIDRAREVMAMSEEEVYAIAAEGNPDKVDLMKSIRMHLLIKDV